MGQELKLFFLRLWPFFLILVVIPGISFGVWWIESKKDLSVLVIDKTVPNSTFREHKGLFWALEYDKYIKKDGFYYDEKKDYLGFFPSEFQEDIGEVKDLIQPTKLDLEKLVQDHELFYYADTYGVYENNFFASQRRSNERSNKIYGGLSQVDIDLLTLAKENEKTIVAEYNTMASPTLRSIRSQFERLMGLKWTGWIGRYFDELDVNKNGDLPQWLISNYRKQNDNQWPFIGPGMVFVNELGEIEIFVANQDFTNTTPLIRTQKVNKHGFSLPEVVPYPDWFDVVLIERDYQVISYFDIGATSQGLERLREMGLPRFFPAAVFKPNGKGEIYYMSGDFSDMQGDLGAARFKGLPFFYRGLYVASDYRDRQSFFWNYYLPLTRQILQRTHQKQN
jgi:hypothetical protein